MAEVQAKVQNATEVKNQSFGSKKCAKNIATNGEETDGQENWDEALVVKRQSQIHPAFSDCVEVNIILVYCCC